MCMFCTQAFARFAARLHPQLAQPGSGDASAPQAHEGVSPPPAVVERSPEAEPDAAGDQSNGLKASA
jgi:hypothetical protein